MRLYCKLYIKSLINVTINYVNLNWLPTRSRRLSPSLSVSSPPHLTFASLVTTLIVGLSLQLMSGVNKITAERNQRILLELVNLPGNGAETEWYRLHPHHWPTVSFRILRWFTQMFVLIAKLGHQDGLRTILVYSSGTSANVVFGFSMRDWLCMVSMNCASIHRKIGTHITKVYVASRVSTCSRIDECVQEESDTRLMVERTSRSRHLSPCK